MKRTLVIELGAGTHIPSVRHSSHRKIHEFNGRLIRTNPTDCKVPTSMDIGLQMSALEALSLIIAELLSR